MSIISTKIIICSSEIPFFLMMDVVKSKMFENFTVLAQNLGPFKPSANGINSLPFPYRTAVIKQMPQNSVENKAKNNIQYCKTVQLVPKDKIQFEAMFLIKITGNREKMILRRHCS